MSSVNSRQILQQISTVLVDSMGSDLSVVNSARVSFGGSKMSLDDKDVKLIKYLAAHDHMCHDVETEVLTDRGWLRFAAVTATDKLAAVQPGNGKMEFCFEAPERVVSYPFNGTLVTCRSAHVDFAVTGNHRMWVAQRYSGGFRPYRFVSAVSLGDSRVQAGAALQQGGVGSYALGQLYGFYLGDGFSYSTNYHAVRLKKARKIDYLNARLRELQIDFRVSVGADGVTAFTWLKEDLVLKTGDGARNKHIDPNVWNAYSTDFFMGVLDGLKNSDGSVTRGAWTYCTTSPQLAEDFERLTALCGEVISPRRKNKDDAFIYTVRSRSLTPRINDVRLNNFTETRPYNGHVYCATVSTGLLLTRRNGQTLVSGNSPFEHCTATVKIECPIYISKQVMRHRTGAYNEISRRYTSKDLDFYTPAYREQSGNNRQASTDVIHPSADIYLEKTQLLHKEALNLYNRMIEDGVCKEQARGVLPQNLMTEFFMTMNLRNWAHFIKLRRYDGAQKEIALIADAVSCILKDRFPISMEALLT